MKVLLFLCAWIATATAHGVISYPVAPLPYHSPYIAPVTTVARPLGVTYTGYPLHISPHYFTYSVIPNNVIFPGVVHYLPVAPADGKGKPDKKKPKDKEEKDKKEETTTEEPKKEDEGESKPDETEDLAH